MVSGMILAPHVKPTYMYDVSFSIDHDVTIVTVLDLQDITRHRVRRHRLDEVKTSSLKGDSFFSSIFGNEEVEKVVNFGATHFIPRGGVRYHVDHTALM